MGVLGSVLLVNEVLDDVADIIRPEHFYLESYGTIFATMLALREKGNSGLDAVTVADALNRRKKLEEVGGANELLKILEATPHAAHAVHYAEIVRDMWRRRQAMYAATTMLRQANDRNVSTDDLVMQAEKAVFELGDQGIVSTQTSLGELLTDTIEALNQRMQTGTSGGVSSGFTDLDEKTNGFHDSQLIILAARPGMGKTAISGNIALAQAMAGVPVLFFSLEQSAIELTERLLCAHGNFSCHKIRKGDVDAATRDAILVAAQELGTLPLHIDASPGRTITQIASLARRHKRRHGLGVLFIDYIQLIEPEDRRMPREQQVSSMSRRLKCLAKELHIPIIALAQLNRAVDARADKTPILSDLRESGSIEQDADTVLFLHRPEMYAPEDHPGEAELTVAKNRSGPTGKITFSFRKESMQFLPFAPDPSYQFNPPTVRDFTSGSDWQ